MSVTIKYNGSNVATVEGGNTATLPVKNKKMATDIIVTVPENKGEVLPDHTDSDFTLQLANTATGELGVVYSSTEKVAFDAAPNGEVIETFFDVHFVPSNIKKDVEIFGVTGEYGGGSADDRVKYVTYMDRGAELIKYPVIEGDTARDPVAKGYIEKPTKEPTTTTVYPFGGWSKTDGGAPDSTALQNVTEDRTVYAAFTESARTFTVNFYDGDTLVHTEQVAYGGSSSYTIVKDGFTFVGWSPSPTNVTTDIDCYAQWEEKPDFATASWEKIAEISESGKASETFAIGATRTAYIDGKSATIEIIGFNHATIADGSGKKAGIIVWVRNANQIVASTSGKYDNTGNSNWQNCATFAPLTTLFEKFDADLAAVVKTVGRPTSGNPISCKVFPLCAKELGYSTFAKITSATLISKFTANKSGGKAYDDTALGFNYWVADCSAGAYPPRVDSSGAIYNPTSSSYTGYTTIAFCI